MSVWDVVASGSLDQLKVLVQAGENLRVVNAQGETLLHVAVKNGHRPVAAFLLVQGLDPNAADQRGATPLHEAALAGNTVLVQVLIRRGADPHRQTHQGNTPLHCVVARGHGETVDSLLSEGVDARPVNQQGQTAGELAAAMGFEQMAARLGVRPQAAPAPEEEGFFAPGAGPETGPSDPPSRESISVIASEPSGPLLLLFKLKLVLAVAAVGVVYLAVVRTTPQPWMPQPQQLVIFEIVSGGNRRAGWEVRLDFEIKGLGVLFYEGPGILEIQKKITMGKKLQVWIEPLGGVTPSPGRVWQIVSNGEMVLSLQQAMAGMLVLRQKEIQKNTVLFGVPLFFGIVVGLVQMQDKLTGEARKRRRVV